MRIKITGITSFCVAGVVVQPDENGFADVSEEVLASDDFLGLRGRLEAGQSIEKAEDVEAGEKPAKRAKKDKAETPDAPAAEG